MSEFKKWWIDDVEESVCARVDHPKRGLHNMPWPDCEHVHVVMLVSDHEKQLEKLRKGNEMLRKMGEFYADEENWDETTMDNSEDHDGCKFGGMDDYEVWAGKRARQALKEYAELMGEG